LSLTEETNFANSIVTRQAQLQSSLRKPQSSDVKKT